MTRLFIGTAAYRSVDADTVDSMLSVALGLRSSIEVVGYRVAEGHGAPRNAERLALEALSVGADLFLYHDADMRFTVESANRIVSTQLSLENRRSIACAPYERADGDGLIVGRFHGIAGHVHFTPKSSVGHLMKSGAVVEAEFMGLGFAVLPTDLFRSMDRPWFRETWNGDVMLGPDVHLCGRIRESGGTIACDFGCKVEHRSRKWLDL